MRWSSVFKEGMYSLAISLMFISCNKKAEDKDTSSEEKKLVVGPKMEEAFPFSEAAKIEVTSYYFMDYHSEEASYDITEGKLPFDEEIIKEQVVLDNKQQQKLFNVLNTDICPKEYSVADCYMPEHRIVFYDRDDKVIAFLEVCLQCIGSRISTGFTTVPLCREKMEELRVFFKSVGIRQFSEM